jgi:GntR family transcriptional repressor for pyruvate dehydrogenase complex
MSLRAVQNRSLGDQVFQQLAGEIMSGRYAAGEGLPAERSLAEVFHVNRHVVREALKRLEQVGLVRIAQGGSTRVLDFKRHAGLDLLAMMAEHAAGGEQVAGYLLSVLEMRAAIGIDVVRLCALRADRSVRDALVAIAADMSATTRDDRLFELEVEFWDRLHDGADNLAYRLAYNSLVKGAFAMGPLARQWSIDEIKRSDRRVPLAAAIAAGDAAKAEALTRETMRPPVDELAQRVAETTGATLLIAPRTASSGERPGA